MLKKLRRRLAFLCAAMTGGIFLLFMLAMAFLMESQYEKQNAAAFETLLGNLSGRIQSENLIDGDWLAGLEVAQRCVIALENNGAPMRFRGAWTPPIDRNALLAGVRKQAAERGLDYRRPPREATQPVQTAFRMGDYRCAVVKIPTRENWFSVTVARELSGEVRHIRLMRLIYVALSLAVFAALGALSWWFTGKAVRPVAQGMERQREFVAAASHELKSPLAVIGATASAIRLMPEKLDDMAAGIENECGRLGRLVNDLLLLTNTDTASWHLTMEPLELDTVLIETVEKYEELAKSKGFTLELELPDMALPRVEGDAIRLGQIFSILIDNALSHAGREGEILVRAFMDQRDVAAEVVDHGAGIPEEARERIFDRFYCTDRSRTDKRHFGLGLAVAKELVRLHNGRIGLSETPGGGCTFRVALPRKG